MSITAISLIAWVISIAFIWAFIYSASERRNSDHHDSKHIETQLTPPGAAEDTLLDHP
jgi:uncharacterized membrane protein